VTAAVTADLLRRGLRTVALNVEESNTAARAWASAGTATIGRASR
jgi:hypothetical protein